MGKKGPSPADKYVGRRIRTRRRAVGMSQGKLGEALGLTFQQVQKYELGTNRIGAGRLLHVAHVLDVPITFFFEGAPVPKLNGASRKKR
ncbi:MAG: helix-turn-helix transcriptional regulator [Xanthobacteraceae bacterium]